MRYIFTLTIAALVVLFSSCQHELHFPEPKPTSHFTLVADGKTYQLQVEHQLVRLGDTAHVELFAASPQFDVSIIAKSDTHNSGVGDYFLWCCRNDVFDRTTGSEQHLEIDHIGNNKQDGFIKITKRDDKGFEGTYSLIHKTGRGSATVRTAYTGSFAIYY